MKKKVLSTLLAAVMLLTMFVSTFTAFAANERYGYKVDSAVSGNQLVVTVTLPGNVKAAGGNFNLRYNTDNLTYSKYDSNFPEYRRSTRI